MKRIISFCSVILILAGLLSCVSSADPVSGSADIGGSSVWKVTRGGNTMYLGGSIHILRESDFPLPEEFDLALSLADILVLETDTRQLEEDPEIMQYLLVQMFLPGDQTLRSVLDLYIYELLSEACLEYGIPIESLAKFKPSMVVSMLTLFQMQKLGFVQQGIDDYYYEKAEKENKPVVFLESMQSQIDIIVSMGDGYENEYVLYSLYDMDNIEAALDQLLLEWRNGESLITEESVISMRDQWPQMYKSLITDRHDAWMPQIERFLSSGQVYFVITGLAHMYGPDGLLQLLKNIGCTVEKFR